MKMKNPHITLPLFILGQILFMEIIILSVLLLAIEELILSIE